MKEIWKSIEGTDGKYFISNFGRVYSSFSNIIMKTRKGTCGYEAVGFAINGKVRKNDVHRLVASHFIDNPKNKLQVNHIDGDKSNNRAENLEWVTPSENMKHAYKIGIKYTSEKMKLIAQKTHGIKVRVTVLKTGEYMYFPSLRQASLYFTSKPYMFSYIFRHSGGIDDNYRIEKIDDLTEIIKGSEEV